MQSPFSNGVRTVFQLKLKQVQKDLMELNWLSRKTVFHKMFVFTFWYQIDFLLWVRGFIRKRQQKFCSGWDWKMYSDLNESLKHKSNKTLVVFLVSKLLSNDFFVYLMSNLLIRLPHILLRLTSNLDEFSFQVSTSIWSTFTSIQRSTKYHCL
jgi:hypothetical protein